jgi:hypothetical protein
MLPLDMLTPQIRHYELLQKKSRYANFSDLSTPSYAIFDFVKKNRAIPDMLILVLYLALAMPLWIVSKKFRYADFSAFYLTHREVVACIFV